MITVVVGHGHSPVGKGWGKRIDSGDAVIRLWNWHWQDPLDWGVKYDWGFFEIHHTSLSQYHKKNKKHPTEGYIGAILQDFPEKKLPPNTVEWDPKPVAGVGYSMGGVGTKGRLRLTRGVQAACWALEYKLPGEELILVGFDNTYLGRSLSIEKGFPAAYVNDPACSNFRDYAGGLTKYGNHDYAIEKPLLLRLGRERGVKVSFAQDIWK